MSDLSGSNPTGRFTGLTELYAQYRPNYPSGAADFVVRHCQLRAGSLVVDVGCGTGISSRLFAERGLKVVGIEPNAEMRTRAESELVPGANPQPEYRNGTAEATGLDAGVADAVLAAQAFHWFDADAALQEFHRILKPHGWVVLMWNERDASNSFTAAYGAIIRALPDAAAVEVPRGDAGAALLASALFEDAERFAFKNEQLLDENGVLGRAFSASYAPKDPLEVEKFTKHLRKVFQEHQQNGYVSLRYETSVYLARK